MSKKGKKYIEAKKLVREESYKLDEAIDLLLQTNPTKFDASCEVHFNLGVDPRQADQNIRTSVVLPNGTGKKVRVAAFVSEDKIKEAKDAGASEAGTEELVKKISEGWLEFDIAVATPDQMRSIGKVAKILGQKRLMPNPKVGTVTPDFTTAIKDLLQGKVELRLDKAGNMHNAFGKVSFGKDKLKENLLAISKKIVGAKPSSSKGVYLKNVVVTTSMGPGISLDTSDLTELSK